MKTILTSTPGTPPCVHCGKPEHLHLGRGVWCTQAGYDDTDPTGTQFRAARTSTPGAPTP